MTQPRVGTAGRPLRVTTNSFKVLQLPTKDYTQYDDFNPEVRTPQRRQEIIHKLQIEVAPETFNPRAVYDGRFIMYTSKPLVLPSQGGSSFTVSFGNPQSDRGNYVVRITRTAGAVIIPSDLNALIINGQATQQAQVATNLLQLLIRQAPNQSNPNNGRSYFTDVGHMSVGSGFELWRGYFQSVRPSVQRMLVNIDTSMAAMHERGRVPDIALNVIGGRNLRDLAVEKRDPRFRKLEKYFKGLQVIINTPAMKGRKKKIFALEPKAGNYRFDKDGEQMTIGQYFQIAFNVRLALPDIFGVVISSRNAPAPIIIPAEFCSIPPGQIYKGKLPEELVASGAVLKFSEIRPAERLETIQRGLAPGRGHQGVESPVLQYEQSDFIMNSGMVIDKTPLTITGRVLDPAGLQYGSGRSVMPRDGGWNVVGQMLNTPATMAAWGIVNFESKIPQGAVQELQRTIYQCCTRLGMQVNPNAYMTEGNGHNVPTVLDDAVKRIVHGIDPKLITRPVIIAILPQNAAPIRAAVKLWGDIRQGVVTQCVRETKIYSRGNFVAKDQYCNNVSIKLNARLGGVNAVVQHAATQFFAKAPIMILGADVGHASPGSNRPSVTSLVYSHDRHAVQYAALSRVQQARQEIIEDLEEMIYEALCSFGAKNHAAPTRMIFFRDGVSEGEFQKVADIEIKAIQSGVDRAFHKAGQQNAPRPLLTFIVVGKRHHIRFFPSRQDGDRTGNCPPGFVADAGIQSPICCDFYLQSHGALKGTSRPSHYIVLKDDNFEGNVDKIQNLAYALCHAYAKATRVVSIPAPVYYADLVCSRASFYFDPTLDFSDAGTSTSAATLDLAAWKAAYVGTRMARDMDKTISDLQQAVYLLPLPLLYLLEL
ncbi:hypothetical protein HGRIS_002357 [Hohenbuehelia grisea]|uniref:Piwi domain-containing protein n=1 Tax=Hohenbuehelia grisea TaxID=104357 RepID=A0ABR3JM55_9AGAR